MAKKEAIDASITTKRQGFARFLETHGLRADQVGVIDDSSLELLTYPGLALVGTPGNAKQEIKNIVADLPNGRVYEGKMMDGCESFYREARQMKLPRVAWDRDGVFYASGDESAATRVAEALRMQGSDGWPMITIFSATGLDENLPLFENFGINPQNLRCCNALTPETADILWLENGLRQHNPLTGETTDDIRDIDPRTLQRFQDLYGPQIRKEIQTHILPKYGLNFSFIRDEEHQDGKILLPEKRYVLTINVPRAHSKKKLVTPDKKPTKKFRESTEAQEYRHDIIKIMERAAVELRISITKVA